MHRRPNAIVSAHLHPHAPFPSAAFISSHRPMQLTVETGLHSLPFLPQRHIEEGDFLQLSHRPVCRVLPDMTGTWARERGRATDGMHACYPRSVPVPFTATLGLLNKTCVSLEFRPHAAWKTTDRVFDRGGQGVPLLPSRGVPCKVHMYIPTSRTQSAQTRRGDLGDISNMSVTIRR